MPAETRIETTNREEGKIDKLVGNVIECVETRFDLVQLDVQDKVSDIMASMASVALIGLMFAFMLLLLSIGAAIYLSQRYNSSFIGFAYVSGFYLVAGILLFVSRKRLIRLPVINMLLKRINVNEEN
jgi:uncharacterized membrane protein YqjE